MLSWYRSESWLLLCLPGLLLWLPGLMPTFVFNTQALGGGPIREWLMNHTLMTFLSPNQQADFSAHWQAANTATEVLWYSWVVLNLFALMLPLLYGLAEGVMRAVNLFRTTAFLKERQLLKTSGS